MTRKDSTTKLDTISRIPGHTRNHHSGIHKSFHIPGFIKHYLQNVNLNPVNFYDHSRRREKMYIKTRRETHKSDIIEYKVIIFLRFYLKQNLLSYPLFPKTDPNEIWGTHGNYEIPHMKIRLLAAKL